MSNANPMADALGGGLGRRRKPGESAGASTIAPGPTVHAAERRVSVDVPRGLYTEAKVLAAQSDLTIKQIIVAGLRAELQRMRGQAG